MITKSTAWLVALQAFSISGGNPFRVYLKVPFGGVRHHSLKGFDQNVASWNSRTTQHSCSKRDGRRRALPDLDKPGLRLNSRKFSSCYRRQKRLCRVAPHVIDHDLESRLTPFPHKCFAQFSLRWSEPNGRVGTQIGKRVQCLLIA